MAETPVEKRHLARKGVAHFQQAWLRWWDRRLTQIKFPGGLDAAGTFNG
jgi:hypothetical protein